MHMLSQEYQYPEGSGACFNYHFVHFTSHSVFIAKYQQQFSAFIARDGTQGRAGQVKGRALVSTRDKEI